MSRSGPVLATTVLCMVMSKISFVRRETMQSSRWRCRQFNHWTKSRTFLAVTGTHALRRRHQVLTCNITIDIIKHVSNTQSCSFEPALQHLRRSANRCTVKLPCMSDPIY